MTEHDPPQIYRGRYKIVKKLGAGNFGTAYLVTDLKCKNESKVLKVVRLGEMDADQSVDSVREAELLSNLHNEHIVKFYESFLENDCLCIVTEYCEGGDLDQRLKELKKQDRRLEESQIVEWLIQILLAVQYMHKSRILHRDLKARNIFLKSNQVKIGDFGISRILVGTMDVASTFTGTPYYMSPEVMKHDGYESKSDIWSVGCLLYEMCTCQHAFDGKGLMNVIYKVVEGTPPELPKAYSAELNDLLKRMFTKEPKQRPSAIELLQSGFILEHCQKSKMSDLLENTVSAHRRLRDIQSRFESPMNFGEMKKQSWSLTGKDHRSVEEDGDDDEDVQLGNNTFYKRAPEPEEFDEGQETVRAAHTYKTAKETMIERKMHEADARGQVFSQAIQSNVFENALNRQLMRESTMVGSMKQPWPSARHVEVKEQPRVKLAHTMQSHTRHPNLQLNERTYAAYPDHSRSNIPPPTAIRSNDDRPITPMRTTYRQIADKFNTEDGLPMDPALTNQYYEACNDFEQDDDQSPTRELRDREFNDQVCRSFNGTEISSKAARSLLSTQRSTINSMSRTIDPHHRPNPGRQSRYVASSRTIGSARKQKDSSKSAMVDAGTSFKDSPSHDAFGPVAKNKKITSLRSKAVEALGQPTFDKVHDYLIKQRAAQRTDETLDESRINNGLRALIGNSNGCFLVDQLVFLEFTSNENQALQQHY